MAYVEYTRWVDFPRAQLRVEIAVERGNVQRFIVQLEYDVDWNYDVTTSSDWRPVARFDHDAGSPMGHDIRAEGLHLDVYRGGEKAVVVTGFPYVPLDDAIAWCESYLDENADAYLRRFERRHDL